MTVPSSVVELVERFQRDITAYKSATYNETQTRQEFIDPLFEALGWDIGNRQGAAAAFREVVLEYSMKIGAATKAPDYLFQLGGIPRFFVEAKKPSVNIKDDTSPAFQLRRYAWSATLPLSVLTDFEEFVVYDCRVEPDKKDKAAVARMFYVPYTEYAEKWDTITELFSREAVLGGSLEKFAQEQKAPKGATPVDVAFLHEIEGWRELLAKNIAIWNPELTQRALNYAVQMTLDRIIFLRICEDRGIEPYGKLQRLLKGGQVYKQLVEQFRDADDRYNSGLFHFATEKGREEPDNVTLGLYIDDEPLKKIVRTLYYPDSPYEFSVLPVEILGNVYEQFLGKVIHLTESHEAVVEEKPEVRKAGGVYYTPSYIVDYIVKNTVGKLLEDKTPKEAAKLRIVDPACGSGSFLIGTYQFLLDWYRDQYIAAGPRKYRTEIQQLPSGEWRLTSAERKRILLNNIYGVDIDAQAVEVTKLSLSLKVLEGETQFQLFQERALPDLRNNIKCGNALIGSDFYDNPQANFLEEEEQYRINVFDWGGKDGFPEIMQAGGFDGVVGNPPWGASYNEQEKAYFRTNYQTVHVRTPESFNYFIYRVWATTKQGGIVGIIIPSSFLNQFEFWKTRKLLIETASFNRICNLGDGVFNKVTAPSSIIVFTAPKYGESSVYIDLRKVDRSILSSSLQEERGKQEVPSIGQTSEDYILHPRNSQQITEKCNRWPKLKEIAEDVATGISSGLDAAFIYSYDDVVKLRLESDLLRKLVIGREINRYSLTPQSGKQIIYVTSDINIENYPNCYAALLIYRERLSKRVETVSGIIPWYTLYRPRRAKLFDRPKILIRQTADRILAAYDTDRWYCLKSAIIVQLKKDTSLAYEYLLALMNSRLMHFLYDDLVNEQSRVFPEVKPVQLFKLPIRIINFDDPADNARHDQMVSLVERMHDLHKRRTAAKTAQERTVLQRQSEGTDRQIDKLVYELYGLTNDEIAIVEEATK